MSNNLEESIHNNPDYKINGRYIKLLAQEVGSYMKIFILFLDKFYKRLLNNYWKNLKKRIYKFLSFLYFTKLFIFSPVSSEPLKFSNLLILKHDYLP